MGDKAFVKVLKNVKSVDRLASHLKYIGFRTRDVEENTRGFFNQEQDKAQWKPFYESIANDKALQHDRTVKAHKLVLSMREEDYDYCRECGRDYKDIVRSVMTDFAERKGVRVEWLSAIHENEGHPHAHLVIKAAGYDADNHTRRIKITKDDIKFFKDRFEVQIERHYPEKELHQEKQFMEKQLNPVTQEHLETLWRNSWGYAERFLLSVEPNVFLRGKIPLMDIDQEQYITDRMNEFAEKLYQLENVSALSFLPKELQEYVGSFSDWILSQPGFKETKDRFIGKKNYDMLRDRISEQFISNSLSLVPRELPKLKMIAHEGRLKNAIDKLLEAKVDVVKGDVLEAEWTTKTMYRSFIRLGTTPNMARKYTASWGIKAGISNVNDVIKEEQKSMDFIKQRCLKQDKPEPINIGKKDWDRLRNNIDLEDNQFLNPWFGLATDKEKPVSAPPLVEDKIDNAIKSLFSARSKPNDPKEVQWTIRSFVTSLKVLGVDENRRNNVIRAWCREAGVNLPDFKLSDILDRTTVSDTSDYFMGNKSWNRLLDNLGVSNRAEIPWQQRHRPLIADIFNALERSLKKEILKAQMEKEMAERRSKDR